MFFCLFTAAAEPPSPRQRRGVLPPARAASGRVRRGGGRRSQPAHLADGGAPPLPASHADVAHLAAGQLGRALRSPYGTPEEVRVLESILFSSSLFVFYDQS